MKPNINEFLNNYKEQYKNIELDDSFVEVDLTFEEYLEMVSMQDFDDIQEYEELVPSFDIYVETPNNYTRVNWFIKKEKMDILEIKTETKSCKVSEHHLFPQTDFSNIYAKDVEEIITKDGVEEVISKEKIDFDNTCDLNIEDPHLFYCGDILHHNSSLLMSVAASYTLKGFDAVYFTLEMPQEEIAKRIDANLINVPANDLHTLTLETFKSKIPKNIGDLHIKEYSSGNLSVLGIKSYLKELYAQTGKMPKLIFIDYLALMKSDRVTLGKAGGYLYYKSIAEELHGMAKELGVAVITAQQLGRAAFDNLEAGADDVADSIGVIQTADVAFGLLSTELLRNEDKVMVSFWKNRYTGRLDKYVVNVDYGRALYWGEPDDSSGMVASPQTAMKSSIESGIPGMQAGKFNFGTL